MAASSWMTALENTSLAEVPLSELYIPGSHDSGCYDLNTDYGFAEDLAETDHPLWLLKTFWFVTSRILLAYSLTQRHNISEQLARGVRYLDLRVALRPADGQLYIVHAFYGPRVEVILAQVAAFLDRHPKEVVILDFQHVHNFKKARDHARLINLLVGALTTKLAPAELADTKKLTLATLWSLKAQALVYYRASDRLLRLCHNLLLDRRHLTSVWGDQRHADGLRDFLLAVVAGTHPGLPHLSWSTRTTLFVTQAVLTPDAGYVARHPFGSLEANLAAEANALLAKELLPGEAKHLNRRRRYLKNIVMFDFVGAGEHGASLLNGIIQLNRLKLRGADQSGGGGNKLRTTPRHHRWWHFWG